MTDWARDREAITAESLAWVDRVCGVATQGRPVYEKETDRENQRAIVKAVFGTRPHVLIEMPPLSTHDFEIEWPGTDDIPAILEVKRRFVHSSRYPAIYLSEHKVRDCVREARQAGRRFLFVIGFDDCAGYFTVYDPRVASAAYDNAVVEIRGRRDRGDAMDMEPCRMFRMIDFERKTNKWTGGA